MRRCRERIDREGEAVLDRWNQVKIHPLLAAENAARAAFFGRDAGSEARSSRN
jgi:hypothetical protein